LYPHLKIRGAAHGHIDDSRDIAAKPTGYTHLTCNFRQFVTNLQTNFSNQVQDFFSNNNNNNMLEKHPPCCAAVTDLSAHDPQQCISVEESEVHQAVFSFPTGLVGGPDGLRISTYS